MFIEPGLHGDRRGWIEVICGSMFSGKTEELIRRLKRVKIANRRTAIFKPAIEVRYDDLNVVSHDSNFIQSIPVADSSAILPLATDVDVVGIDEAQFFDEGIIKVSETLALNGVRVIVAGFRHGLSRQSFWTYATAIGCCRLYYKTACNLCSVRKYCKYFLPQNNPGSQGCIRRERYL